MDKPKSTKLACTLYFSESKRCPATAHLFEHLYSGYNFWYGVMQIGEFPTENLPERSSPTENLPERVQVAFKDGRKGLASFWGGYMQGGYMEFAFSGITPLQN